jgi:hypothetical protein
MVVTIRERVVTVLSVMGGTVSAASRPFRRELEFWRWRRNFRERLPSRIQDPRAPSQERSNGPVRVRLLSYAIGSAPARRAQTPAGTGIRAGGRPRPT